MTYFIQESKGADDKNLLQHVGDLTLGAYPQSDLRSTRPTNVNRMDKKSFPIWKNHTYKSR